MLSILAARLEGAASASSTTIAAEWPYKTIVGAVNDKLEFNLQRFIGNAAIQTV